MSFEALRRETCVARVIYLSFAWLLQPPPSPCRVLSAILQARMSGRWRKRVDENTEGTCYKQVWNMHMSKLERMVGIKYVMKKAPNIYEF